MTRVRLADCRDCLFDPAHSCCGNTKGDGVRVMVCSPASLVMGARIQYEHATTADTQLLFNTSALLRTEPAVSSA